MVDIKFSLIVANIASKLSKLDGNVLFFFLRDGNICCYRGMFAKKCSAYQVIIRRASRFEEGCLGGSNEDSGCSSLDIILDFLNCLARDALERALTLLSERGLACPLSL